MTIVASTIDPAPISTVVTKKFARSSVAFVKGNITAISAGDVISDSSSVAAALEFLNCASKKGGSGVILAASVLVGVNPGGSQDYGLLLFDAEPTNFVDGANYSGSNNAGSDGPKFIGAMTMRNTTAITFSGSGIVQPSSAEKLPFVCAPGTTSLFALLVTQVAGTFGSADKIFLNLGIEQD